MTPILILLALPAQAAPTHTQVISALEKDAGWSAPETSKGVAVSTKSIPGLDVPAFRGVRTVDVSCDVYFRAVSDPNRHKAVNDLLEESKVVRNSGGEVVFYQVVDLPLVSHRYWINAAVNERNLGGVAGHHRQSWRALDKNDFPEIRDRIEDEHGAVFTELNYGFWDLMPAGPAACTITYAAISDPGGSIPGSAGAWASEKSLPDNINSFYEAAKR